VIELVPARPADCGDGGDGPRSKGRVVVPEVVDTSVPVVAVLQDRPEGLDVSQASRLRALLLVHALTGEVRVGARVVGSGAAARGLPPYSRSSMVAADSTDITRSGRIIFLNGTSSSGKTSIAEQLLLGLDRPYFHLSVDAINAMRAKARTMELDSVELDRVLKRTRMGFRRAVAGMALAGNDLVVDYVLSEPWRLADCLEVWAGLDVVLIGVRCSLQELERRERARGDRNVGQAAGQLVQVNAHGRYDFEVDTTFDDPARSAARIMDYLARHTSPGAFEALR
jgi:chloramphenicol 3-O phosphotransferase